MGRFCLFFLAAFCVFFGLRAEVYYEGTNTFRGYGKVEWDWLVQFLPYNPVIVEAGAYCGDQTLRAAEVWPQHKLIVAFEPNPWAFDQLKNRIENKGLTRVKAYNMALHEVPGMATLYLSHGPNGRDFSFEHESSLLPPSKEMENRYQGYRIQVPCVSLDEWCKENQIDHIDILRLELEGLELPVLRSAQDILKRVHIVIVQSFFRPYRKGMTYYFDLKDLLTKAQFVPLAHWYEAGDRGLAVYVSQEMFDAYFVKCLGLGLGGLLYP